MITYEQVKQELANNYVCTGANNYSLDWKSSINEIYRLSIEAFAEDLVIKMYCDQKVIFSFNGNLYNYPLDSIKPLVILDYIIAKGIAKRELLLIRKELTIMGTYIILADDELEQLSSKITSLQFSVIGNIYYVGDNTASKKMFVVINAFNDIPLDNVITPGYGTIIAYLMDETTTDRIYILSFGTFYNKKEEWWKKLRVEDCFEALKLSYANKPDCVAEIDKSFRKFKISKILQNI